MSVSRITNLIALALLAFLCACSDSNENFSRIQSSIEQRFNEALEAQSEAMAGNTTDRVQAINQIINQFLPEAAAKLSRQQNISLEAATRQIREQMEQAADRAESDYVKEFGYGSIVLDLRSAEALEVIRATLLPNEQ